MKLRLTVTREWDYEPEAEHFQGDSGLAEWPLESGQTLDVNDPAQVAAFMQHQLDSGEMDMVELLEPGEITELTWRIEHVVEPQVTEEPDRGQNPFLTDDQPDAGAKAEASGAAAESDEDYVARRSAEGNAHNPN